MESRTTGTDFACLEERQLVREDNVTDMIVCGPDPAKHIEKIQAFAKAGYDHVYVHQVGPDQEGFANFMNRKSCQSFGRHYI